jgi:hypothetical protein
MKILKLTLFLFLTVSALSCSDNSEETIFDLSVANIAGTYSINSLNIDTKVTSVTDVAGVQVPFTVATSTSIGDTFQVDFILNTNNSYTASGQYRVVTTVYPAAGSPVTNTEIINLSDSGTYQLNTTNNTITFTSSSGDFLEGTLSVAVFNETTVSLTQETENVIDAITTKINASISFTRQ